jgi:hypothetical protein
MVLALNREWVLQLRREHAPRALSWALLAAMLAFFAWTYLADGKPSPYGICYASRGVTKPCGPVTAKAVDAVALPVATTP